MVHRTCSQLPRLVNLHRATRQMAPPHLQDKGLIAECDGVLKTAYEGLRTTNEQLQDLEREIYRLIVAKMTWFPDQSRSQHRLPQYTYAAFGGGNPLTPQWLEWAACNGLLESAANLDRELEKANASKTIFEGLQNALRRRIDKLSRPTLRSLNILFLPDEILLGIFELVEDFDFRLAHVYCYGAGRMDIANIRLVCRQFCNVSSQLLLRSVSVNFNEPSLARLDEISRHPTIAKGVRAVRVVLHFHKLSFNDLDTFISHQADQLENAVSLFEESRKWEPSTIPEHTASEMITNGRVAVSTLRRQASADTDNDGGYLEDDRSRREHLAGIHREYLILFEKQALLIKTGEFCRLVGSAIARMPSARRLEFTDAHFASLREPRLIPGTDVWSTLYPFMLQPMTGYHTRAYGFESPNYECIINVIEAVRNAGTLLSSIDIKLSTLACPTGLVPAPDIRREFSSGMQQLEAFSFKYSGNANDQDVSDLHEFLSTCLDTASLQRLTLDMKGSEVESPRIDVGQIMGSMSRHKLTNILLHYVAVEVSKLKLLLERLPQSMNGINQMNVMNICLLSGTWKDALDVLRRKARGIMALSHPRGAECDSMSQEDYERIFGHEDHACSSEAEMYINRCLPGLPNPPNPIQALEDELSTAH
ncbi:hypothetical protein A9K55_003843 [Cordyceps militaris]|uniref:Uncharacterized protein n=1 Tax=Cordyceps militaris TaxID=73501 RepID=A0A2H4SPI4_CORMI|nr:hypothetical protein A9K55_003843 [Cordyceps militaris]